MSACNHNGMVAKVEHPAAILSDLAKAGGIPDNLVKEGISLEPWSLAYTGYAGWPSRRVLP